jgi:hypothetical protein
VFPFRLSRIGEAFFRINFFFQCNKALLKCDSPTVFGEGRVGSASAASKKEPHPALPEDGEGRCIIRFMLR